MGELTHSSKWIRWPAFKKMPNISKGSLVRISRSKASPGVPIRNRPNHSAITLK